MADSRLHPTEQAVLEAAQEVVGRLMALEGLEPWQEPQIEDEVATVEALERLSQTLDDYHTWDGT